MRVEVIDPVADAAWIETLAEVAVLVSLFVISLFAVVGQQILGFLGIGIPALQGAGGLLLLIVALELLTDRQDDPSEVPDVNVALVPLGTPLLAGPGGFVFGRDAQGELDPRVIGVNTEGALKGAQMIDRLLKDGHMPQGVRYSEMESNFARGQVAMMINGPWAWDNVRKVGINFGVAPIPSIGGKPGKPFVGVLGCMITAPSKLKDVAREFIENHLLTVPSLKTISADVPLGTPANKAYFLELSQDPNIVATMANARAGEPIPNIPEMGRFFPAMDAALEAITNGRQAPKDALDGAAARMITR